MFRNSPVLLYLFLAVFSQGHPLHPRRRLAPNVSIIDTLNDQLANGIDHPRFTLTTEYNGEAGLFSSSKPFEIDVVLTNPSVEQSTTFSVDGGPSASVQTTSKFFISDQMSDDDVSKHFAILTVDEERGMVTGLVQKDGKLLKLEQRQGGPTFVTEVKYDPPKDWECSVAHEPEHVAKDPVDPNDRRLAHTHKHDHDHIHHEHETFNLSPASHESIFSQVSDINPNILRNRRMLYATDTFPNKWSYQVDLYIEVDANLVNQHDTDTANMPNTIAYVNALITAASSVYEKEVDTHLHVLHIAKTTIYDSQSSTSGALDVMYNRYSSGSWHFTDQVSGETPDLHHAILGRSLGGGIAYLDAVCSSWIGYGVSAGIRGSMQDLGGMMFWDLTVIMHEIGHNFGSHHTHDTDGYNPKVDACGDQQCTSLVTGAYIKSGESTIMSYCHTCSGGVGNIGATFGGYWKGDDRSNINNWISNAGVVPFSQEPKRVSKTMYEHVSTRGECVKPYLSVPSQVCSTDSQCDDGNSCTTDRCNAATGKCSNVMNANCCGNSACEAGESGSTCSADCGPFTLPTPTCSTCYTPYGAMFDVEAIHDIVLTSLNFLIYSGSNSINIYSAPNSYSSIATNPSAWTRIASGSVSTSNWATITADITDTPLSAGSKRAFYIATSARLAISDDANTPLALDDNLKLLNPTRISYSTSEFGSANNGTYSWVGSMSYTINGGAPAPSTNLPTTYPTQKLTQTPTTKTPSSDLPTNRPTQKPTTPAPLSNRPTTSAVSGFTKVGQGYCLDAASNWYSAFYNSATLPISTADTYCLDWCAQNLRPNLAAVEMNRDATTSSMTCYCSFSGGAVPNDISLSDFDPAAGGSVSYAGVGAVQSIDAFSTAVCYRNNNFMVTPQPTPAPSKKPISKSPTNAPTRKPITTAYPTNRPSQMPITVSPTRSPSRKPITTAYPTNRPSQMPITASPTRSPSRKPITTANPTNRPSQMPIAVSPTRSPSRKPTTTANPTKRPSEMTSTVSPTHSSTEKASTCYPRASVVKLESTTGQQIHAFEVKVYSSGNNVALGGRATQSSTYKTLAKFEASQAIDGNATTFSHTDDSSPWWQVDSGTMAQVDSVEMLNRWCSDPSDANGCLCRLSNAQLTLLDNQGSVVATQLVGNTCGKLILKFNFDSSFVCSGVTPSPTPMKSSSPVAVGFPNARQLKLHSITGLQINVFEVEVYSSGVNVAKGKPAAQSSTLNLLEASRAVDGDSKSFSHTNDSAYSWWQVDLGGSFPIESVRIINRWCRDPSDENGCLCRLSYAVLSLFDEQGRWVATTSIGNTCGQLDWTHDFNDFHTSSMCTGWS